MIEQEIFFKTGLIELSGTLALPDLNGQFPAVLLIPGSGQTDRNDNAKKLKINAFVDISRFLTNHGIASLRFDKRGVGKSQGNYWETGFYDRINDVAAALNFLKRHKNINSDKVFLLGHSEGALISTNLAGTGAEVAGIILLAGSAQSGELVLKWQALEIVKNLRGFNGWLIRAFHIDVSKSQSKKLYKIKQSTKDWYRQAIVLKFNAKWFREFMAYDPTEDLSRIKIPVLAITGSKDIQVNPEDLQKMAYLIKSPFEQHLIKDMTHILRIEQGEANISNYKKEINRPVEPKLLEIILNWLEKLI